MSKEPQVIYDFDPRNLPPRLLQAIGLMAAASAQTESVVQDFIGSLLGIDIAETPAVTAHMSAPLKDQVARTLIELNAVDASIVDMVDDLLDAINAAQAKRNVVVHNSFVRNPETGEIFSMREAARGSLQVSLQPVRIEEIEQDAALIYDAGMNLMAFMLSFGLKPSKRDRPIRVPLDRKKKTRSERRDIRAGS